MKIEINRVSGDPVKFAQTEQRYDQFFEEERELQFIEADSWDDVHDMLDETYIVKQGGWNFDPNNDPSASTPSKFEGIDHHVKIYDGWNE